MVEKSPLTDPDDIAAEARMPLDPQEVEKRIGWQKKRQDNRLWKQRAAGRVPDSGPLRRYIERELGGKE